MSDRFDLLIAKEETRRQTRHDAAVAATSILTNPIVLTVGSYLAIEYAYKKYDLGAGFLGNRLRPDALEALVATVAVAPVVAPFFGAVVKGVTTGLTIGAIAK